MQFIEVWHNVDAIKEIVNLFLDKYKELRPKEEAHDKHKKPL